MQEGHDTVNAMAAVTEQTDRSLLIVEDDKAFNERLSRAMEGRGFSVTSCETVAEGLAHIGQTAPALCRGRPRLGDGNGLDVVSALKRQRPEARAIVLTGYGNIATAVTAVKMGAVDYLSKPTYLSRSRTLAASASSSVLSLLRPETSLRAVH